jgi:N-acetylglucosamine kinase-like BadF-type ATPase
LGIDAGGSRTEAALAESVDGKLRVLARAAAGSTKLLRVSEEHASRVWRELLGGLAAEARVSLNDVRATCAGLSGYSVERVRLGALGELRLLAAGEILLCGDEEIALDAAFGGGDVQDQGGAFSGRDSQIQGATKGGRESVTADGQIGLQAQNLKNAGVLVIAGTGSHAVTRTADGEFHAGGWGPALGDEGSGYWIGREAVRHALRARDERMPSLLLQRIAAAWQCGSEDVVAEIVSKAHAQPAPDFSTLAPLVDDCAAEGDQVSVLLLHRAGEELARLAAAAWGQSGRSSNAAVRVAWTGSVLRSGAMVRDAMRAALWVHLPNARLDEESVDPVMGALGKAAALAAAPVPAN